MSKSDKSGKDSWQLSTFLLSNKDHVLLCCEDEALPLTLATKGMLKQHLISINTVKAESVLLCI